MREQLEELEDIEAYVKVKGEKQESFPIELVERLILGTESKVKIWREYRSYNVTQLTKMLQISEAYLSQIENHKRKGSIGLYQKIAKVLDISMELLV